MIPVLRKLVSSTHPRADVYSYNFPNDRLLIKFLGASSTSCTLKLRERLPRSVYFAFALETTQTVLTGADIYYWFISGFGNFERLYSSHYGPIDIPIMISVISLMIQMYFCYRIWILTRNVWLCTVIAVVCVPDPPRAFQPLDIS